MGVDAEATAGLEGESPSAPVEQEALPVGVAVPPLERPKLLGLIWDYLCRGGLVSPLAPGQSGFECRLCNSKVTYKQRRGSSRVRFPNTRNR